jgi:hypothetical protein
VRRGNENNEMKGKERKGKERRRGRWVRREYSTVSNNEKEMKTSTSHFPLFNEVTRFLSFCFRCDAVSIIGLQHVTEMCGGCCI